MERMKNKQEYGEMRLEIVNFSTAGIICTSGYSDPNNDNKENDISWGNSLVDEFGGNV